MKFKFLFFAIIILLNSQVKSQDYVAFYYLGLQRNMGTLNNPYTNGNLDNFKEKMGVNLLEFGAEGMDKTVFVSFKSHFFGVIPDYILKSMNKKNTATIYGESLDNFREEYNTYYTQYEKNASFADWDVMNLSVSYGYKYAFVGGNIAWANTNLKAYESVSNTKIREQKPADFYSFNEFGNYTYGLNFVLSNNKPDNPIRLICAYDWMLMRDYNRVWTNKMGTRLSFDLQGNLPFSLNDKDLGLYVGIAYRMHDINYRLLVNGVDKTKEFKSSIFSIRLGLKW